MAILGSLWVSPEIKAEQVEMSYPSLFTKGDKLILAPMQGLTSLFFRKAFQESFPDSMDYAVSPFISLTAGEIEKSRKKFKDVEPQQNDGSLTVVPQLLGNDADNMIKYIDRLCDMGYKEVNLNLACPAKTAVRHGRGAALLRDYRVVDKLLGKVVPVIGSSLSVKIRIGYDTKQELPALIDVLNSYPLNSVIVHPRLAVQLYGGELDFEAFDLIEKRIRHRLIYNGEITSVEKFNQIKLRFPRVKDFMIGRGLLANPFLAAKIKNVNFSEGILKTFFFKLEKYYAEYAFGMQPSEEADAEKRNRYSQALTDKMKEFCKYLFPKNAALLSSCSTMEELNANVSQMFR